MLCFKTRALIVTCSLFWFLVSLPMFYHRFASQLYSSVSNSWLVGLFIEYFPSVHLSCCEVLSCFCNVLFLCTGFLILSHLTPNLLNLDYSYLFRLIVHLHDGYGYALNKQHTEFMHVISFDYMLQNLTSFYEVMWCTYVYPRSHFACTWAFKECVLGKLIRLNGC